MADSPATPAVDGDNATHPVDEVADVTRNGVWLDVTLAAVMALVTLMVHDVRYVLNHPYWLDEAWVAVSSRLPLSDASDVTSSTPLGWTLLLRLVVFGGPQRHRLIPLGFAMASVAIAYFVGRAAAPRSALWSRVGGVLVAAAVLLNRSSLVRNDLKQYTADAFFVVLVMLLALRVEARPSWRRHALLAVAAGCGFFFSIASAFAAVAAYVSLAGVALGRRNRADFVRLAQHCGPVAVLLGVTYLVVYRPHVNPALSGFWADYWVPRGWSDAIRFLSHRGGALARNAALGPLWVAVPLVVGGSVVMWRNGLRAGALFVPVLFVEALTLGLARRYPLFDERTSYYLVVGAVTSAAVACCGVAQAVARRTRTVGLLLVLLVGCGFTWTIRHDVRTREIPLEDVRTPARYVFEHLEPDDVVVVNAHGSYGFSYYWPGHDPISWWTTDALATGFFAGFRDNPDLIYSDDRTEAAVSAAVHAAVTRLSDRPAGRIWIVRGHVTGGEVAHWQGALADAHLAVQEVIHCSLLLATPAPEQLGALPAAPPC